MAWQIENFKFDRILIKDHASMRMIYRNISKANLYELIESGEVIEDYPDDFPYPSKLVFKVVGKQPLHLVLAYDDLANCGIVVTIYEVDSQHFEDDFKTRK